MSDANNENTIQKPIQKPIHIGSGADAMEAGSWYDNAYYQILLVEPIPDQTRGKFIRTTIVAGQRIRPENTTDGIYFSDYQLDDKTIEKLNDYPKSPCINKCNINDADTNIATYLPSSGVVFPEGFIDTLTRKYLNSGTPFKTFLHSHSIEISNFYEPIRTLLHTRKTSQLIAKTWYAYLHAKDNNNGELWNSFTEGKWHEFVGDKIDILDGLIAREIFLSDQNTSSDHLEPDNLNIYYPLKSQYDTEKTRFLILPNSRAWQGIALGLLLSGQAYYGVDKDGKYTSKLGEIVSYHQVSQPILSTGEIVMKYGLEVSWDTFKGDIIEMSLSPGNNSIAYQAIIPYPPIPSSDNLNIDDIKAWADAEDDPKTEDATSIPFFHKRKGSGNPEEYLVDVRYFSPPFPYIPLSCS
ncbi:hypothetical protein H6G80_11465 [Nostoc sp. FACHB-87]|uniref:hypothetical protein n=1 Tax=Nostocaceae TaxID=1162 RepID=UPI0016891EE2|nr:MULTISPECIES: hypothetical protein [Nostocaceae]MBD2454699.1 hypothetical protein [Nostoc sp. FACHB-87]MBD2475882.1 hypothetical protein [Anabaena sp. FACHB-83]